MDHVGSVDDLGVHDGTMVRKQQTEVLTFEVTDCGAAKGRRSTG